MPRRRGPDEGRFFFAIHRQLVHAMEVSGMKSFEPVAEKSDPNRHQAVVVVPPAEGQESGTVATVFQKGWMIQERSPSCDGCCCAG